MNAAVRAHRILGAMENYRGVNLADDWSPDVVDGRLGEPVGRYRNPGPEGEVVGIFADGLAWHEDGRLVEFRFTDVSEVALPDGKESELLLVALQDGKQLRLPVRGGIGRFFDSMEMLRFLDRVTHDLRK